MREYSDLSVLIVDPNPSMRGSLQNMLTQALITKIEYAVSAGTAIRHLTKQSFDLILCEYDLGGGQEGQDGQQLLEDLRHHKLIGMETIFIMITSEGVYNKVMSAAELTPTDYILKPFTVDVLSSRINRAVERRAAFLPVYQRISQGDPRAAIQACIAAQTAHPRHATEFARLRAELYLTEGELASAEELYRAILSAQQLDWAMFGLAKTQFALGRHANVLETLGKLLEKNAKFITAHDLLAKSHEALGQLAQAQQALESAVAISPNMVRRLRHLGEVALKTGDVAAAERAFKQVVAKAKYSEFRDPADHLNLVKALVKKGDAGQAASVIRDLDRSQRGNPNAAICRAMAASMVQQLSGTPESVAAELKLAIAAASNATGLTNQFRIELVLSCLSNGLDQDACDAMLSLMNDPDTNFSMENALTVFDQAGRPDLARGLGAQVVRHMRELISSAAEQSERGEHRAAVAGLAQALRRTPNNMPVLFASVDAILKQIDALGWDRPLAEQCVKQMATLTRLDPKHPMLQRQLERYAAVRSKFNLPA